MDLEFWRNKTVFLTGHTGFKGAWMSFWLHQLGATVFGCSLPPNTSPSLYEKLELNKKIKSVFCDVTDFESLKKEIDLARPEIIFHMAAQPLVQYSYRNPYETFNTNVLGTVCLLEAVRCCLSRTVAGTLYYLELL